MTITIKQLIELEVFQNSRLVCGKNGLNNTIRRVSFFDCPVPEIKSENKIIQTGDFYITSFYLFKDRVDEMEHIIKLIIERGSSGIVIIDNYLDTLPEKLLGYADKHSYPIIFIDKDIPYGNIISSIMELIIADQENKIKEMKVEQIVRPDLEISERKKIFLSINSFIKKSINIIYYTSTDNTTNKFLQMIIKEIDNIEEYSAFNYKNGVLFILSSDNNDTLNYETKNLISKVNTTSANFAIGISKTHENLNKINQCFEESFISNELSSVLDKDIVFYNELKVYKLLLPYKNSIYLKEFYNETIKLLKQHDNKYNSDLLETLINYVNLDGDYKKIAKAMFQHENTIRYRITKIKDILNLGSSNIDFIEQIALAIKIEKIFRASKGN